jgi:signal transduction histidine kinase
MTKLSPDQPLPRSLTFWEYLSFSLTGLLVWQGTVGSLHAALGLGSLWVWLPCVIVAVTLNLQLRCLASRWPQVAGGSSSYILRLLSQFPRLSTYTLWGYYLSWAALVAINSIILTDLIKIHTEVIGLFVPGWLFKLSFTLLPFILAFGGVRALAILQLFFMVPTVGLMLLFVVHGLGWLIFSPNSPGLLPTDWPSISLLDWVKWYFIAVYAVYAIEGGAAFMADSREPTQGNRCLKITAGLTPIVYLGGSWIVGRLATNPSAADSAFLNLLYAAMPFWGESASIGVTLLIGFTQLLSSAATVALCSRVLYQASRDGHVAQVFGVVSRQGVAAPALVVTLLISLGCLIWGDVVRIILITGTGYVFAMMILHLGIWLRGDRWRIWALCCGVVEFAVLVVGGLAWNWVDFLLGLVVPGVLWLCDRALHRSKWPWLQPQWWQQHLFTPKLTRDFLFLQINLLLVLVCGSTVLGWVVRSAVRADISQSKEILVLLVLSVGFSAVAIAAWTSVPQVRAIAEAEEQNRQQAAELQQSLQQLKSTQMQLVQSEKMSSLGQLVAGIAHEINNPINFIYGNVVPATNYIDDLLRLIKLYEKSYPEPTPEIAKTTQEVDLQFLQEDLPKLLNSMKIGADRVRQIVVSLRNFSRLDESDIKAVDIHEGIDSSILILHNRIKARSDRPEIQIVKNYGSLPLVECYAGQINQVFMNILANAIDALEDNRKSNQQPTITITTKVISNHQVEVNIHDNGQGIPMELQHQIFNPFFTTKPIGKGTGLGLSISHQIVNQNHKGLLDCLSKPGQGTSFIIHIPIKFAG